MKKMSLLISLKLKNGLKIIETPFYIIKVWEICDHIKVQNVFSILKKAFSKKFWMFFLETNSYFGLHAVVIKTFDQQQLKLLKSIFRYFIFYQIVLD